VWKFFSEARSKASREKSAEDIVPEKRSRVGEGLNLIKVRSKRKLPNGRKNAENIDRER
jgi:hypothetical protein